jgi:hypothetical protein
MTKKITIKQRQEIYEYLLTLNCPDLLAALTAERSQVYALGILDYVFFSLFIEDAFIWSETPEGFEFWRMIHESVLEIESKGKHWLTHPLDYDLPVDLEHKMSKTIAGATLDAYTSDSKELLKTSAQGLSFWAKAKLFLGKWVYKV